MRNAATPLAGRRRRPPFCRRRSEGAAPGAPGGARGAPGERPGGSGEPRGFTVPPGRTGALAATASGTQQGSGWGEGVRGGGETGGPGVLLTALQVQLGLPHIIVGVAAQHLDPHRAAPPGSLPLPSCM